MADVAVEIPVAIHKRPAPADSVPIIDSLDGSNDSGDEYATLKRLQRHLE
jgi:26S proteasome regulatory subunit T3